jgi:hypothetical protein
MDTMFAQAAKDNERDDVDVVVGGQLITYDRMLPGDKTFREAKQRGWLKAMVNALLNPDFSRQDQLKNVHTIAEQAVKRRVLTQQQVDERLQQMLIPEIVAAQKAEAATADKTPAPQSAPEKVKEQNPFPAINYDAIAQTLPLDPNNPPLAERFVQPIMTNMFKDEDEATLGGRMISNLYSNLVLRPEARAGGLKYADGEIQKLLEVSKAMQEQFAQAVLDENKKRVTLGQKELGLAVTRASGSDGFHFNGDTRASQDFLFYFSKSHEGWKPIPKNPDGTTPAEVRAYITLKPGEEQNVQKHFSELALKLYNEGIDFTAKAASVFGARQRADNMVFYISPIDQARASQIIKEFLQEKQIGQGAVQAAVPSPEPGLSWAMEPTKAQMEVWKEISGSSENGSFNVLVATMALPAYLDRLVEAHMVKGNTAEAEQFKKEAQRVRAIIAKANIIS